MSFLEKVRLPYRGDSMFGILFFVAFLIPLAFDIYNFESFEIVKFGLLSLLVGLGLWQFYRSFRHSNKIELRGNKVIFWTWLVFLFWDISNVPGIYPKMRTFNFYKILHEIISTSSCPLL